VPVKKTKEIQQVTGGPSARQWLVIGACFVVAAVFWNSWPLFPVKLFVVLLHELSHGAAAMALGGSIVSLEINARLGGSCQYLIPDGFLNQVLVTSAGYLGSMVWGGLLLWLACRTRQPRVITLGLGVFMVVPGVLFIISGEWFGVVFTLGFAAAMVLAFKYLPGRFHGYILKFVALTSCLYVIVDIKEDLIDRTVRGSDADIIASLTGIPSLLVGLAWAISAIGMLLLVLRFCLRMRR
jgi:hypothetical protein